MAYDGTLKFDTQIDDSGFQSGLDKLSGLASGAMKEVVSIIETGAAAITGLGAAAVSAGKDFESSMSNVAAISGAAGSDLVDLTNKAMEMGAKTKYSASESAAAFSYMAMAGWDAGQMIDGIEGIMNLAAASGENLSATADIVTDALTAFGLGAGDAGHFADILAAASSNANTNVGMMGETFKYVAPLAGALKLTAEDVAEAVGLMANAGIKASQAGTALRGGLSCLVKPTDDMLATLKKLGLAVSEFSDEEANARKKALDRQYDNLKKAFSKEEDALKESLNAQYDAKKKAFDKQEEALSASLDAEYDSRKKAYDAEENARKESLDAQYDAAKEAADKQLETLKEAQEAEVEAFERATDEKIAQIDRQYTENLKLIDEDKYNRIKAVEARIDALNAETEAERAEIEKREREQKRANLQARVNNAKTADDRAKARRELSDYLESLAQKDREANRKAQIAALKDEKNRIKEEAEERKAELKERTEAEKNAVQEESKARLTELKKAQLDERTALKNANERALKDLKKAHSDELSALKTPNSEKLAALKASHKARLSALKESNDEQLAAYKKSLNAQTTALKDAHDEQLADCKESVKAQTEALKEAVKGRSIVLTDEAGNMRTLNESLNILREAFAGLSEDEQAEAATILFGQEAMSGWPCSTPLRRIFKSCEAALKGVRTN